MLPSRFREETKPGPGSYFLKPNFPSTRASWFRGQGSGRRGGEVGRRGVGARPAPGGTPTQRDTHSAGSGTPTPRTRRGSLPAGPVAASPPDTGPPEAPRGPRPRTRDGNREAATGSVRKVPKDPSRSRERGAGQGKATPNAARGERGAQEERRGRTADSVRCGPRRGKVPGNAWGRWAGPGRRRGEGPGRMVRTVPGSGRRKGEPRPAAQPRPAAGALRRGAPGSGARRLQPRAAPEREEERREGRREKGREAGSPEPGPQARTPRGRAGPAAPHLRRPPHRSTAGLSSPPDPSSPGPGPTTA